MRERAHEQLISRDSNVTSNKNNKFVLTGFCVILALRIFYTLYTFLFINKSKAFI